MKSQLLFLLAATASAYQGEWCDECTTLVNAFDTMDAQSIADQICPIIGHPTICEELAPFVIDWVQEHCTADMICSTLCDEEYQYYIYEDPPVDLHEARDLGHHPFDLNHPTEDPPVDLHEARELGHHPFDIPTPPKTPKPIEVEQLDPPYIGFHEVHHEIE